MAETNALVRVREAEESYRLTSEAYMRYAALLSELGPGKSANVDSLYMMAKGYAWGRQDQGLKRQHTNDDWRFAAFYGLHCIAYEKGEIGCRLAVRNAFDEYMSKGTINGVAA